MNSCHAEIRKLLDAHDLATSDCTCLETLRLMDPADLAGVVTVLRTCIADHPAGSAYRASVLETNFRDLGLAVDWGS